MRFLRRFRSSERNPDEVLAGELLVLTPDTGREPGVEILDESREVSFVVVSDEHGRPVLPAFTSEKALARWKPDGSAYIGLQGGVLLEILASSDWHRMVVDGADDDSFAITRADARARIGPVSLLTPEGSSIRIGMPAREPPKGLVDALRSSCQRHPEIIEAYLFQSQIVERDEPPQLTVGLLLPAMAKSELERISTSISGDVDPESWGYESIDYLPLDEDLLEIVRSSEPIVLLHRES